MIHPKLKAYIADKVQDLLKSIHDNELPNGEIHFILHVDGAEDWPWANIRNASDIDKPVPDELIGNLTVK